ncbi:MAG TPA: NrfD/PsrC family molybdoenzyme membrane anchor subunit, partial [Phycicoccus sp.]
LNYDVKHTAPWDWRVSLYTWTKGIGAGGYLVALLLLMTGRLSGTDVLWTWVAPVLSAVFLATTAAVLIWDLEHPERFVYILTRPQWRSWLVRGGIILSGYAAVLAVHVAASLFGWEMLRTIAAFPGLPLAVGTAVYTAYLFAQAKARDLWQSPLLAPHLVVQAVLAGSAALVPFAVLWSPDAVLPLAWTVAGSAATHLLLVAGETTVAHPTAHARLAAHTMTRGRYARFFWAGVALVALGLLAPVAVPATAWLGLPALLGLLAHEHAYVQSGQSVPLA